MSRDVSPSAHRDSNAVGVRVVVVGGSAAGSLSALMLARSGHDVTIVEREDLAPAGTVEDAAAGAFRASAPQIVQPHAVLPACREIVRERLPDVYENLLDAGVLEAPMTSHVPPGITDRGGLQGDELFPLVMTRRSTVDWVLARATSAEPRVQLRYRTPVIGLVADPGDPPRVRGVRTPDGELPADLVVDATGRRTQVDRWLGGIGARSSDLAHAECGLAYYSRQYRVRDTAPPGPLTTGALMGLDEFVAGIWGGDNGAMQLALAPLATDRRFAPARSPEVFTRVLRTVPLFSAWLDALDPVTDVHVMGGLHNTLRRLVVDGAPVALGLYAVGDSVCTTNPTFGRGLSMAAHCAADLTDALAAHPDDPHARSLAMDHAVTEHLAPWYADQVANDTAWVAMLRHSVEGAPAPPTPPADRLVLGRLRAAAQVDALAFRALWRVTSMVGRPDDVYDDPALVAHVRAVLAAAGPPPRPPQPTRAELEAALAGCGPRA
jgi:2-polyprenyl-6-methoxyphenol hydroxylase-like FAD-dependent oxidoreductase